MTEAQQRIYEAIVNYEKENGRYPRQTDVCKILGKSKEAIRQFVNALVEKGFVEKVKSKETSKEIRIKYTYPTRLIIKK